MNPIRWILTIAVGVIVAMLGGLALIVAFDFMSRAFAWTGVESASTGWLVLGVLIGALAGLIAGLRRAGRPMTRKQVVLAGVGLAVVLSAASAGLPDAYIRAASGPAARVLAEGLNVREQPNNTSDIVGQVARGQTLRVLQLSGDGNWYRVETEASPRVRGWVGARFVSEPTDY